MTLIICYIIKCACARHTAFREPVYSVMIITLWRSHHENGIFLLSNLFLLFAFQFPNSDCFLLCDGFAKEKLHYIWYNSFYHLFWRQISFALMAKGLCQQLCQCRLNYISIRNCFLLHLDTDLYVKKDISTWLHSSLVSIVHSVWTGHDHIMVADRVWWDWAMTGHWAFWEWCKLLQPVWWNWGLTGLWAFWECC